MSDLSVDEAAPESASTEPIRDLSPELRAKLRADPRSLLTDGERQRLDRFVREALAANDAALHASACTDD